MFLTDITLVTGPSATPTDMEGEVGKHEQEYYTAQWGTAPLGQRNL